MTQNDKNFCLSHMLQEPYIIWSSFMVHMYVWKDNISRIMRRGEGVKRAKITPYLRNHTSYDCDFWCTLLNYQCYRYFSLFFLKKPSIVNIKIILFYWPNSTVFLRIICFSSSSMNANKNSEVCPIFTCVWFFFRLLLLLAAWSDWKTA